MTITLSTDELASFQAKLSEWYDARSLEVMASLNNSTRELDPYSRVSRETVIRLMREYEAKNPKPGWRSLL